MAEPPRIQSGKLSSLNASRLSPHVVPFPASIRVLPLTTSCSVFLGSTFSSDQDSAHDKDKGLKGSANGKMFNIATLETGLTVGEIAGLIAGGVSARG